MKPTLSRKSLHMTLCGKGGVGKSVIARLLTEYLPEKDEAPLAFDADPVNASFAAVRDFDVEKVTLIDADQQINPGFFDQLVLRIVDSNRSVVLDTGAASYVPLFNYMRELDIAETLNENGFDLFFHVALAGGPALPFTVENLREVCLNFGQDAGVMVWLNHYWEEITHNDKPFTELPVFKTNQSSINGLLEIERMAADTSAEDFAEFLKRNISFEQALDRTTSPFNIVEQSRLFNIRETIFEGMDAVLGQQESTQLKVAVPV